MHDSTTTPRRAFVTGGSGFVGRSLIPLLVERGFQVRALARSDAAARTVATAGAEPVRGDLDDEAALRAGMIGCTIVFHAAAHVEVWGRRADFLRINVDGTQRVLDAARASGVRRVVHVSTEAVLVGGGPIVRADEKRPLPAHPIGLYPETKGLAEKRVLAASDGGLETVIVRPRFIWGQGDTTLLPNITERMRAGRFAWIGGGRHLTSTCHVRNVSEGALAAAERGRPGEIYFLTDGEPVEFRDFLTRMCATAGVTPTDRTVPFWLARALAFSADLVWRAFGLSGEPPLTPTAIRLVGEEVTVDDSKARRELGYLGAVSVDAGLAEMRSAPAA